MFRLQRPSGIWEKFFPMFYYFEPTTKHVAKGGANYCFTFEFLEAILCEFGYDLLDDVRVVRGLEKAVEWCRSYRVKYKVAGENEHYHGWNSGQQVDSLMQGSPSPGPLPPCTCSYTAWLKY